MAYDGIQYNARVDSTTERKLNAKVVDNILNSRTFATRLLGMGKPMLGKTFDYPIKIVDSQAGEFFTGLENLSSAASDTLITLSYAHTAFQQPKVSIMVESFANAGPTGTIDLDRYKYEEAVAEALQKWGSAIYGTGTGSQPLGLGAIVDDGTSVGTIGGQSRTTYTTLKSTVTAASSGLMSLTVLATLWDNVIAAGIQSEVPTINLTTKTVWTLYEQLLTPTVRADYQSIGYNAIPLRGSTMGPQVQLKGAAGFDALSFRGKPVIADDAATSGVWFMLNERYFEWRGRTIVPSDYAGKIEKIDMGLNNTTLDGTGGSRDYDPPSSVGWFVQKDQMLPQQAGQIGRLYCIGQVTASQFRRHGKETGITTI